ncbi:MAG TPA: DUF4012 domain-containing protein [Acidimicrobiales bacterium]|nr:DUF4012 domain-containing protein [Acidimicrobiales bacterium]
MDRKARAITERASANRIPGYLTLGLALAAAGAAVTAGCHPTGYPAVDYLYVAVLAGVVTLAASLTPRGVLLVVAVVGVAFSRGWLLIPGLVAVAGAFACALPVRAHRPAAAAIGAVEIQVILRWPAFGFHGLTALVAGAAVTALFLGAWTNLGSAAQRWLGAGIGVLVLVAVVVSVPALAAAYRARAAADSAETSAKSALSEIEAGQAPQAAGHLRTAGSEFGIAHDRADPWWSWGAVLVPVVAQQHHAVAALTEAGAALAREGARQAAAIDFHGIRAQQGRVDLAAVEALTPPLEDLQNQISATLKVAADRDTGWLLAPLQHPLKRLSSDLTRADQSIDLALQASRQVPTLLGAEGEQHYLVMFMTPAETRGLGGFLGAYAEVDVDQGRLTVARTGQPKLLVDPSRPPKLTGPADYLARYGAFDPQGHLEDVSYSPDFPSVAEVLAQLYPQVGGDRIDGVLVLDPYALGTLLQFTGPITIPGFPEPLDSANAAQILLKSQYLISEPGGQQGRHDLLEAALSVGFQRLTSSSLPAPKALGQAMGADVHQGRLLFWSSNPDIEALINRLGLRGQFPAPPAGPSDLTAVTIANAANDKLDAYLTQRTDEDVTFDPSTGAIQQSVTISLTNTGTAALPYYVSESYVGSGLPLGTNKTWVSLYTPFAVTGASLNGQPVAMGPATPEVGVNAYSIFVTIPAGATDVLRVTISGQTQRGPDFSDAVRLQPLANPSSTVITVRPTDGWRPVDPQPASWTTGPDQIQTHTWKFTK